MSITRIQDKADNAVDKAAEATSAGITAVRDTTNKALDKADAGVDNLNADMQAAVDALAERALALSQQLRDTRRTTGDQLHMTVAQARDCVAKNPFRAVCMAAAFGAVLTLLLGRRR